MARIADIERRLLNWARWKEGSGTRGLGYGSSSIWQGDSTWNRSTYRESRVPTIDCEAAETDDALNTLLPELRQACHEIYIGPGAKKSAAKLHVAVSTLYARVDKAHVQLARHFTERAAMARAEAQRIGRLRVTISA